MSVAKLLQVEMIKLRRRTAFTLAIAIFVGFTAIMFGAHSILSRNIENAPPFMLPASGAEIHMVLRQVIVFFSFVTVVNLCAAEYPWRTARQNVIDGWSREQFVTAKLLLIPVLVLLFFVLGYGIALGIAATGGVAGSLVPAAVLKAMFGVIITAAGVSSLALLASFATRHTAGAIAIVLGYLMLGESLIALFLSRGGESVARLASFLPATVFMNVSALEQYAPSSAGFMMAGREPLATPLLLVIAIAYITVFCVGAYLIVRRQDL